MITRDFLNDLVFQKRVDRSGKGSVEAVFNGLGYIIPAALRSSKSKAIDYLLAKIKEDY
jgi:hypothetical protein